MSLSLTLSSLESWKTSVEVDGCLECMCAGHSFVTWKVTQLKKSAEPHSTGAGARGWGSVPAL